MAYNPATYEAQRRALLNNYTAQQGVSDYANFISNQRGARGLRDLNESFEPQRRQIVSGFGRRGLRSPQVQSGAFRRAMVDFGKKQIRDTADYQRSLDEQNQQYGLQSTQRGTQYQQDLIDIEREKANQINNDAMAIWQMRMGA
jgi:hypothetical protein